MASAQPYYAFNIPSIADDISLSCRLYQPCDPALFEGKAAIVAHPYAPLGGCFDDPVVLATKDVLLRNGFIVGIFNFRGAGDSEGRTSWNGRSEQEDYISFAGFMIYYVSALTSGNSSNGLETIPSVTDLSGGRKTVQLLLGGYSYGSLVLARLPSMDTMLQRFQSAEKGTAAAEIILRTNTLAKQTLKAHEEDLAPKGPHRGRQLDPKNAASPASPSRRIGSSPITVGGEESEASSRRRSREARHSADVFRKSLEEPHRIKAHFSRASSPTNGSLRAEGAPEHSPAMPEYGGQPVVEPRYLVLSPFLLPFTDLLSPPGAPSMLPTFRKHDDGDKFSGSLFKAHPTLAVFGSADGLTNSRRLRSWAEKMAAQSASTFEWSEIQGAGHFWREKGVMKALQRRIESWLRSND